MCESVQRKLDHTNIHTSYTIHTYMLKKVHEARCRRHLSYAGGAPQLAVGAEHSRRRGKDGLVSDPHTLRDSSHL